MSQEAICKSTTKDRFSCQNKEVKITAVQGNKTGPNEAAGSFIEKLG